MGMREGWGISRVCELFEIQLGKMLNKKASQQQPQFQYLGNREVQWGRFDLSQLRSMHFSEDERKKFRLRIGDLLVCEGGEVGRAALWRGQEELYYQKALHRLRPINNRVSPEFMLHFMRYAADSGRLIDYTSQSSIAHLTREKLAQLEVLLPPLPEQMKIAAILSSVDEAIEATQAVVAQLQVVKKAMMGELLTKGIPGRHSRFKKTEIGEVPEGWGVVPISDLGGVAYGLTVNAKRRSATERHPYLTVANLKDNGFDLSTVKDIGAIDGDIARYALRTGDVLVIEGNANPDRLGRAMMWEGQLPGALHQNHLIRVRPHVDRIESEWLALVLNSDSSRQQIRDSAKTSSGLHTINSRVVAELLVPVPSAAERTAIVDAIGAIQDRIHKESEILQSQNHVKSALLSVLLTGEVRVRVEKEAARCGA